MKNDKKFGDIYVTTNYRQFKSVKGNRAINKRHVHKLMLSMQNEYLISPIIVNKSFGIIDGQHRCAAVQALELPLYYIVVANYGLKEVQIYNINQANWGKKEWLKSYCERGYDEYIKFAEFMKLYPAFTINNVQQLLTTNPSNGKSLGSDKNDDFYAGKFSVVDWEFACRSAEKIMAVEPLYDGFRRRSFVFAMIFMFQNPEYNHAEFMHKLGHQPSALTHCTSQNQYKMLIEEIYNYRRVHKVNLRFPSKPKMKAA